MAIIYDVKTGKTKKAPAKKSQAKKDSEKIYSETKDSNKRDKYESKDMTRSYDGLELPIDVYRFITNVLADGSKENETNRELVQSYLDGMRENGVEAELEPLRNWIAEEHPEFVDDSYSSTHTRTSKEKSAKAKKILKQALADPNLKAFTNVPDAPLPPSKEPLKPRYEESDKDKKIREQTEKVHKDDVAKVKAEQSALQDFTDRCIAEYDYTKMLLKKTSDPSEKQALQEQLMDIQADLSVCFKKLGITAPGAKEGNSAKTLKDLLDLYNKQRAGEDAVVSNAVNEEVHYGSADPDSSQFEKNVDAYKQAQAARKVAVEERAKNKKALQDAKQSYNDARFNTSRDLGEDDETSFLSDPSWMSMLVTQSKSPVAKKLLKQKYADELSAKEQEYYNKYAEDRYNDLDKAGLLDKYKDRFASGVMRTPDVLKQSILTDLKNEVNRVNGNIGRMRAEYMRDLKFGKKPSYRWEDIPALAAKHGTEGGYEDVLYSSLPDWKSLERDILSQEQNNSDPEVKNGFKNKALWDRLMNKVLAGDAISLEPDEYDVVDWLESNGQDVIDNPQNYSYRARFLANEWLNSMNKLAAQQAYDKSKQDVRDQEDIMHKNKEGYDNWKDFASRTNINELVNRLDALKASIEKHNKNDEIHSADFHQLQMSDEERKQIRELQAQIARLSMGKSRKVDVSELGDGSYMATASGEGAAFRYIMKPEKDDPSKFKVYQARPRLSVTDMEKVSKDPNLSDAEKNAQMYVIDGPAIGFVGSNDDLTFTLDTGLNEENSEYSKGDIKRKAAENFAKKLMDYGLGRSPDSVNEYRQYKENKKQDKLARRQEIRNRLLSTKGFDNLCKAVHLGNAGPDRQEAQLYSIFNNTGIFFDPVNEVPYGSLEEAKAAGADMSKLKGPDESLGKNAYSSIFDTRRKLGVSASAAKIKANSGSFKDANGNTVLNQKASNEQIRNSKYAQAHEKNGKVSYHSINEGEAGTVGTQNEIDVRNLGLMRNYSIDPDKFINGDTKYRNKILNKISTIADVNDRDRLTEFINKLSDKHGKAYLDKVNRYYDKRKESADNYKNPYTSDPLTRVKDSEGKEQFRVVMPSEDSDPTGMNTDWFKAFKGAELK